MIKISKAKKSRVCQGDIYRNIEYIEYISEKNGIIEVSKIVFPYVVILTQDCDLAQDYLFRWSRTSQKSQDKWLISVLVAPLYNAEHVFQGEHMSELDMKMSAINKGKSPGKALMRNKDPRFHFLEFPEESSLVPSIIDFKHYFSVNVGYLKNLKKTNFVCSVSPLYREDISQRFSSFLARIGLPAAPVEEKA